MNEIQLPKEQTNNKEYIFIYNIHKILVLLKDYVTTRFITVFRDIDEIKSKIYKLI